ncbi:Diphosphomevalonate decarboxylase [Hypsibius exemplaris]|uniref:Diphosphomevalonate decarboxylase n=1 Tax=Hypsibius exemplaris TaxID=2072580 RepID=A0A1W0X1U4_HYPEX|nr:Diphosphomevalonate decarboxylase [Hypsibius exemplaris]
MAENTRTVTCEAPVNIAVIKYWGKSNEELIIPLNDSISVTLSTEHLRARTTIRSNSGSREITFSLDGKEEVLTKRFLRAVELCRAEAKRQNTSTAEELAQGLSIVSENNFPTAAGLASSAAGFACLVTALKHYYRITGDVSGIVRQGSGSACRSVFGGFVRWLKGTAPDGSDSIAQQVKPASHWPEMRVLILVVSDHKKETSSTHGMKTTAETSRLLKYRADVLVPQRCAEMTAAITAKNFAEFAEITMRDSNQFHAVCLDTYPPIFYLNSVSQAIIEMVHIYNQYKGTPTVAYSFDAGPNAFLFTLEDNVNEVAGLISATFSEMIDFRGLPLQPIRTEASLADRLNQIPSSSSLRYVISTTVGDGAKIVHEE